MLRRLLLVALAALALAGPSQAQQTGAPIVVELFTSQGCSSCPPADALLAELAERPDVIALSLHVDYWNYIGWTDPFSSAEAAARQQAYRDALGLGVVYTPQMVIDGRSDAVGSQRSAVEDAIGAAAAHGKRIVVTIAGDGASGWRAVLPAVSLYEPATVWLARFDAEHATRVTRGENAGAVLHNRNVVRELVPIAEWNGAPIELPFDVDGRDGCAVIVQRGEAGPVLGAAMMVTGD